MPSGQRPQRFGEPSGRRQARQHRPGQDRGDNQYGAARRFQHWAACPCGYLPAQEGIADGMVLAQHGRCGDRGSKKGARAEPAKPPTGRRACCRSLRGTRSSGQRPWHELLIGGRAHRRLLAWPHPSAARAAAARASRPQLCLTLSATPVPGPGARELHTRSTAGIRQVNQKCRPRGDRPGRKQVPRGYTAVPGQAMPELALGRGCADRGFPAKVPS
jgi:hypothetical protein